LPVDEPTRRYLETIAHLPATIEAEAADARLNRAARTFVLWHEPLSWASRSGLGLYSLDRELRRLAAVAPDVYPELVSTERPLVSRELPPELIDETDELLEFEEDQRVRERRAPRPAPALRTRMEVVDAAPGSLDILLGGVGSLVELLNTHGVLAVATAITLAQGARPFGRIGIRVLRAGALTGKRITISVLRGALRALEAEPKGRFAVVIRVEADESVTVVVIDTG
jgi:hypothetical protein